MNPKYFFLSALLFISFFSMAQDKEKTYQFHSINSISLLNGINEVSAGLQSVNGLQKGNWFLGLGAGLDYYIHRSVPVFADLRYEYGKGKNKFFAYADGGINFEWVEPYNSGPIIIWEAPDNNSHFRNGLYSDLGLGYLVGMKKGNGLVLSISHSYKSLKETVSYQDWRSQDWFTDIYRYRFSRIAVKVGWKF